jgi:hypothetical protein
MHLLVRDLAKFCMRVYFLFAYVCVACACTGVGNQNYEYLFELDCAASRRCACVVRVVEIRIQELKAC